jgi:hypothetical protein
MANNTTEKIKEVYVNLRMKLDDIANRKMALLTTYRTKIEEEKIKELKDSLKDL